MLRGRRRQERINSELGCHPDAKPIGELLDVSDPKALAVVHGLTRVLTGEVVPTQQMMFDIQGRMKTALLGTLGVEPAPDGSERIVVVVALNLRGCEACDRVWGIGKPPGPYVSRKRIVTDDEDCIFEQMVTATVSVAAPDAPPDVIYETDFPPDGA